MKKNGGQRPQKQCSIPASRRAFSYAQGKTDTETNFVVTVGFTIKVDHQTTSKNQIFEVVWWSTLVVKPRVTTKFVSVSVWPSAYILENLENEIYQKTTQKSLRLKSLESFVNWTETFHTVITLQSAIHVTVL